MGNLLKKAQDRLAIKMGGYNSAINKGLTGYRKPGSMKCK